MFFLLSAFTIFCSSKAKYAEEVHPTSNFYIRRVFRILPLWWLVVSLYMVLEGRGLSEGVPSYLMYFGLIRYQPGSEVFPLGWTIFAEETVYVMLPIIFSFVQDLRRAVVFCGVMIMLSRLWVWGAA